MPPTKQTERIAFTLTNPQEIGLGPIGIGARHNGKANVLFCDGHVASLYTKDDTNSPRNPADLITDDKLLP